MARRKFIRILKTGKEIYADEDVAMQLIELGEAVLVNSLETTTASPAETAMKRRGRFNKRG